MSPVTSPTIHGASGTPEMPPDPRSAATPFPLLLVSIACFASNVSARATDPMLPLIADKLSVTLQEAAWLSAAYGIPYAVSQPILGPVADALGKSRVIKICLALLAGSFALCALTPNFLGLLAARGVSSILAGAHQAFLATMA